MQPEITEKQYWYVIDGPHGTEYVPCEMVPYHDVFTFGNRSPIPDALRPYCENAEAYSITRIYGYGVRLTMPGFLDCTDWTVYTNKREAIKAARELMRDD